MGLMAQDGQKPPFVHSAWYNNWYLVQQLVILPENQNTTQCQIAAGVCDEPVVCTVSSADYLVTSYNLNRDRTVWTSRRNV